MHIGGFARVSQELGQSHKVTLIPEGMRLVDMIS
jgi:hypothetical protein